MNQEIKSALFRVLPFMVVLIVVFVRIRQGKINPSDLHLNKPVSYTRFSMWVIGFLAYILITELALYNFGILEVSQWHHPLLSSIIRIFGAVILAPIAEEIIFRGLLLYVLTKKLNRHLSIFLQACFFVLLHNFAYENTLSSNIGIAQSLIDACLFGYAKYHTKSLYTSMAMHITGNFVATAERFVSWL